MTALRTAQWNAVIVGCHQANDILPRTSYLGDTRVEAGYNTSTVALRVVRGDKMGTQCSGVQLDHPVPGAYKYGDLALQVGGVSDETVKYGREFCGTSTQE
jgi:hypothetical protein